MVRNDRTIRRAAAETAGGRIDEALASGRTALALQPVVHADRPERTAFREGLIRLRTRRGCVLEAASFIGAAEADGTVPLLDAEALRLGLDALRLDPTLRLSLNLSPQTVGHQRWTRVLEEGLERDPTAAERLILEVTGRTAIPDGAALAGFMEPLHAQGVSFALDGFGAGFASVRVLRDLRFDLVKLDAGLCHGTGYDGGGRALVEPLVGIGHHLGCLVVAGGIETQADAAALHAFGVDCLQGRLFGPPVLWTGAPARERPALVRPRPAAAGCPPPARGLEAER